MSEHEERLDRELARILQRMDAPDGFAERVMARATAERRGKVLTFPRPRLWVGGAVAAMLVMGLFAGERVHQQREQERANQQFEAAMRVTDHALDQAQEQLERAGLKLGD